MVEKSVSATTSGNTVVAKLRTLAPGEVVSGGYFKGFERTDEYVQDDIVGTGRRCWATAIFTGTIQDTILFLQISLEMLLKPL